MNDALVVVTAVAPETRAVLAVLHRPARISIEGFRAWRGDVGHRTITLVQGGIGPARAQAALLAVTTPHDLVLSVGFAGALSGDAAAGDVVLPPTVVWERDGRLERYMVPVATWERARTSLPPRLAARALFGPLLSSPVVVESVTAKRAAASRSGAAAVEMEAAALIAVTRARGADVLVVRTILDGADVSLEGLPPGLDSSWPARARLVGSPRTWGRVVALARRIPHAAASLREAITAVLAAL